MQIQASFDEKTLQELAQQVAQRLQGDAPKQEWAKMTKETRDDLFAGKSDPWIRLFIFDEFPETVITPRNKNGWVLDPHGKGRVTKIYVPYARMWLRANHERINWTASIN